ncbi:MAG: hypothetical protein ACE5IP_09645 [Terriglobia bacterium]
MRRIQPTSWPLVIVFVIASSLCAQDKPQPKPQPMPTTWGAVQGVSVDFPTFQDGAPLQVIGVRMGSLDFLSQVVLVNTSDRTIVKYQLGWIVTRTDKGGLGTPFLSVPSDAVLKPGEVEEAGRQGATFSSVIDDLKSRRIRKGKVIVGVTYVKFEDGTEWRYPLTLRHQFISKPDPALRLRLNPIIKRRSEEISTSAQPQACAPIPRPDGVGTLAYAVDWLLNLFSVQTVYASHDCWTIVCNPAPRKCVRGPFWCWTLTCPLGECQGMQCDIIPWPCDIDHPLP